MQYGSNIRRLHRRFAQVAHTSAAAQVRCLLLFITERYAVAELTVDVVSSKNKVTHLSFVAIAVDVSTFFDECVAIAKIVVTFSVDKIERFNLSFVEGQQLAFLTDTVLIEVAPNAQLGKSTVSSINLIVAVVIKFCQRLITAGGTFTIFEQGVVAEKFAAIIDDTVTITIIDEQTIVLAYPASGGTDAVFIVIKERAVMTVAGEGFDTVTIQIKHKWFITNKLISTIAVEPVPIIRKPIVNPTRPIFSFFP